MSGLKRFSKRVVLPLLVFTALISISSASILVLLSGAPSYACAFWRLFLSTLILALYGVVKNQPLIPHDRRVFGLSTISGFLLAVHFLTWMESLFHVPVAVSTTIVVAYPLYNVVIDRFLLSERITRVQYLGFAMGFTSLILFLQPGFTGVYSLYGVILALASSLAAAGYFSLGRLARRSASLLEYVVPAYFMASISTLTYILLISGNVYAYSTITYAYFTLMALIPMIGGHTVMNYLLRYMKTSSVTAIALGEPVGASILAYILLGQTIGFREASLMALVLLSVSLVLFGEMRGRAQHSANSSQCILTQKSSSQQY